jgi:hypothetical protein
MLSVQLVGAQQALARQRRLVHLQLVHPLGRPAYISHCGSLTLPTPAHVTADNNNYGRTSH